MDIIFKIAIILLPFDNLFFAPSKGWATITPIIFFIYLLFNIKYIIQLIKKAKKSTIILIFISFFTIILLSISAYFLYGIHISSTFDTAVSIFLGICSLLAFDIYFIQKKNKIEDITKLLIQAYMVSIIIGWIQFITIKLNIIPLYKIFDFLSMRNYMNTGRVQFSFTEPSFIGMHIFGVLLPLYLITKEKNILKIIVFFIISNFIFNSSVRFIFDSIIVIIILAIFYMIRHKETKKLVSIIAICIGILLLTYATNTRIRNIVDKGIYADSSLSTRYFRLTSSLYGYMNYPYGFIFGYGMGNSIIPMKSGYYQALSNYKNDYLVEIEGIIDPTNFDSNASFCLFTRIISEYGIIIFILIIICTYILMSKSNFKYKYELLLITVYLYLQFDSYAFYTIWIFITILLNYKKQIQ